MSGVKRGGTPLFWSARGSEGGKHTSAPPTTFQSAGVAVVLRLGLVTERVLPRITLQNLSVARENGTRILLARVENAETIKVPRSAHNEDDKYQLNVTAYNHFGFSQSDPVSFFLKDIGEIYRLFVI